jgi:peptidoglycan/LPS O-acetylase OafA/YrhL
MQDLDAVGDGTIRSTRVRGNPSEVPDGMSDQNYRPDIDGLRAVAVSLVLLFHARIAFPGGFIGVDVFFVISGYLITGWILRQQRTGFRLATFWNRRIRRILPASLVMTFITLAAGAFVLLPLDYVELAKSDLAQQAMVSNVFFWRNTGYFAGPAELKPLLHTWSLAVEEQFYLLYPLFLVPICRWRRRAIVATLVAVAVLSLAISEWAVRSHHGASFYLLPTRAWELALGGLLFFVPLRSTENSGLHLVRQGLSVVGISLMLISASLMDASTRFPGIAALVPCLGTALLITSNGERLTLVGRALALKPVVFVGLMSYSLYLWHWPMLALTRYRLGEHLPGTILALLLVAGFGIAWLSWRFVETPFRGTLSAAQQKPVLIGIGVTVPVLAALSLVVIAGRGIPSRLPTKVLRYDSARDSMAFLSEVTADQVRSDQLPRFGVAKGTPRCLVWGDSHAMALIPGIDAACKSRGVLGFQATHSLTAPLLDYVYNSKSDWSEKSPVFNRAVLESAVRNHVDLAILAAAWSRYARNPSFEQALRRTIDELRGARISVAIVLDVADQVEDVPTVLARRVLQGASTSDFGVSLEAHRSKNQVADDIIRRIASGNCLVIDPAPAFVTGKGFWPAEIGGEVLYCDAGHLSIQGSLHLKGLFEEAVDSLAQH